MGNVRYLSLCFAFLCFYWPTQGFAPNRMEINSFLPHHEWHHKYLDHGPIVSRRSDMSTGDISEPGQLILRSIVKRPTTVGGHAETGPYGHSGGISISHESGGTSYGGHIDHGPGGTSGGLSASHTWSHGDGSKTTLGGHVDHSHWGGTSGGISVTHTFG